MQHRLAPVIRRLAAYPLLIALAFGAATAVSACGGSEPSQEELLAEFRSGAEEEATNLSEQYGLSQEALDCIVEGAVDEAESIDLAALSEDEIDARAAALGEAAARGCLAKPGFELMVAEPTEAQATAALELTGDGLRKGFVQGGLTRNAAECFVADAPSLPPVDIASFLNGEQTPAAEELLVACAKG